MQTVFLKNCIKGLLFSLLTSVVLLTVFGYICYTREDPASLFKPLGTAALYISAFVGGFAASRFSKENGITAGLASGGLFMLVVIILSLMLRSGEEGTSFITWLMFFAIVLAATAGGYLGGRSSRKRKKQRHKKRK